MPASSKYGKPIWVTHALNRQLNEIKETALKNGNTTTPGDIIKDLLTLRKIPRKVVQLMREEQDPSKKYAYQRVLQLIIEERKK